MYQSTACDQIRWNTVQKKALFFFPIIDRYGFTQGHKRGIMGRPFFDIQKIGRLFFRYCPKRIYKP